MPSNELHARLFSLGCHVTDIGDAFFEADPDWLSRTSALPTTKDGDSLVYVDLLGEGVDVRRPVIAKREGEGVFGFLRWHLPTSSGRARPDR